VEPCEENDANARLLAAAPRLARELVEARRAIGYITAQAAREADRSDRLEADVSVLRWQIADLERECERLRREWAAARERITTVESAT
jgi:chromosome segregation ATPase